MAQKPKQHLDFIISTTASHDIPSFSPLDSDRLFNAIHLEQMVGTLVRLTPEGRYEGYLAKSWNNTAGGLHWEFQLNPNLFCEDGTAINSASSKKSFERIIRLISSHSNMPIMNDLVGYEQFKNGSDHLSGIEAVSTNLLRLSFTRPITSGLLEYLGLPYLGFYCDNNFTAKGVWKDNHHIISSGAYKMMDWNKSGPVQLKLRNDWPLASVEAPDTVTIYRENFKSEHLKNYKNPFILSQKLTEDQKSNELVTVNSIPSIFHGIVISNKGSIFLKSESNRAMLRDRIRSKRNSAALPENAESTDQFYPHMSEKNHVSIPKLTMNNTPSQPLKIMHTNKGQPHREYAMNLIIETLTELQIPYTVIEVENSNKNMMSEQRDLSKYDLKSVSVDIGGGIENQLVKFMFCSNLGVAFPDPSGDICRLVENYESLYGDALPKNELKNYINIFDKIIEKDASVVPLFKTGHHWLLHKNIDTRTFSPTMGLPYFDLIRFK